MNDFSLSFQLYRRCRLYEISREISYFYEEKRYNIINIKFNCKVIRDSVQCVQILWNFNDFRKKKRLRSL